MFIISAIGHRASLRDHATRSGPPVQSPQSSRSVLPFLRVLEPLETPRNSWPNVVSPMNSLGFASPTGKFPVSFPAAPIIPPGPFKSRFTNRFCHLCSCRVPTSGYNPDLSGIYSFSIRIYFWHPVNPRSPPHIATCATSNPLARKQWSLDYGFSDHGFEAFRYPPRFTVPVSVKRGAEFDAFLPGKSGKLCMRLKGVTRDSGAPTFERLPLFWLLLIVAPVADGDELASGCWR